MVIHLHFSNLKSWDRDITVDGKNQILIGLCTFIQELLIRSKASCSTLQVALYYLVLIQTCIPKEFFAVDQLCMKCGRWMFLVALIIAFKYLHDRSFSASKWSRISGLRICEINASESAFLAAAKWKFHIPEPVFRRWKIVLEHSTSPRWRSIIPHLTPDLDPDETRWALKCPKSNEWWSNQPWYTPAGTRTSHFVLRSRSSADPTMSLEYQLTCWSHPWRLA